MLSILTQFLSNRSQYVVVDGCHSKLVNVVSAVPLVSVLGLQLFIPLVHHETFLYSGKQALRFSDDSTLAAVVPSPTERVAVTESMNRDLNRVSVLCGPWEMKLNVSKTKTILVSRSSSSSPVNSIDSVWNCAEGICRPCHIGGDVCS